MKLQTGLFHRGGRQATAIDLAMVLGEFGSCNAEIGGESLHGSLAIAYRGDRITYEEDNEVQPLDCEQHILTWDGRLDNRDVFANRLGLTEIESTPDLVIVAKAYRQFG